MAIWAKPEVKYEACKYEGEAEGTIRKIVTTDFMKTPSYDRAVALAKAWTDGAAEPPPPGE